MSTTETYIVAEPNTVNLTGKPLEMGDRFEADAYLARGQITESVIHTFKTYRRIVPLTRESYANCMANRPAGTVGKGFTVAELVELGILDAEAAPEQKPVATAKAARAAKEKKPRGNLAKADKAPAADDGEAGRFGDPVEYKGCQIWSVKQGRFTNYEATNMAGDLLRPKRFRKMEGAQAFIDGLAEQRDSSKPATGIPPEAQGDDVHVQS